MLSSILVKLESQPEQALQELFASDHCTLDAPLVAALWQTLRNNHASVSLARWIMANLMQRIPDDTRTIPPAIMQDLKQILLTCGQRSWQCRQLADWTLATLTLLDCDDVQFLDVSIQISATHGMVVGDDRSPRIFVACCSLWGRCVGSTSRQRLRIMEQLIQALLVHAEDVSDMARGLLQQMVGKQGAQELVQEAGNFWGEPTCSAAA